MDSPLATERYASRPFLPSVSLIVLLTLSTLVLTGCDSGSSSSSSPAATDPAGEDIDEIGDGRTFEVEPGEDATFDMVEAMISMRPGDELVFGCGFFELDRGLLIQATEDVTVRGCGKDETILSFRDSENVTGLEALNVRGITIEDLTIADSPGDAFKLAGVKWGTLRNVRAIWGGGEGPITADNAAERLHVECTEPPFNEGDNAPDYIPSASSGRYGIYPVESENILVDNVEAIGASDAGIYVGQTNNALVRNSRAAYNVMGFEIENVQGGEYDGNLADCNTGGFLIYDLENLTQYGDTSVMHGNTAINNNTYNFAPGGLVGAVPRGTGFITLGYDNIEVFDNHFEDHSTAAVIYVSYELLDGAGNTSDKRLSPYTEGLHIHNNTMINSGYDLPPPDIEQTLDGDIESLLPTLIGVKHLRNFGEGAHIVWDGLRDELDEDCPYPLDADGNPVPSDENGKPIHTNEHPNPSCHYNAYKFDEEGERILPQFGSCFADNDFQGDGAPYMNFNGTQGLELVIAAAEQDTSILSPEGVRAILEGLTGIVADNDMSVHDCESRFGETLASLPNVEIPPFEPSGRLDPAPTEEFVELVCEGHNGDGVNWDAIDVNCPRLDQYNLFADNSDPRSDPSDGGIPFVLNSKLFSDYSTKYRVAYVPPGQRAIYRDSQGGSNVNDSIHFPTGTVLTKTFAFTDERDSSEDIVETRLLIKRDGAAGRPFWDGLVYLWEEGDNGEPVAHLTQGGATRSVSWHYRDSDSGTLLSGDNDRYSVPNANQCLTCHSNDDVEAGSAPIGPKPRHLNRAYKPESTMGGSGGQAGFARVNQLQYWQDEGILTGVPDLELDGNGVASNIERLPRWNVPGDSGEAPDSHADIEDRTRAYLEINCQHCHNDKGAASNTGYYTDAFREINASFGICKSPTATGGGSCGRSHVIVPGDADASIVTCRMEDAHDPQRRMPPIAHNVPHTEAVDLIAFWIDNVLDDSYENASACGSGGFWPFGD